MRRVSRRALYLGLCAGWVALTLTLTSIPNPRFGLSIPGADKLVHMGCYAGMGLFFALWRRESGASILHSVVHALLFAAVVGGVDEAHQHWIPGRFPDPLDWLADLAGGGGGAGLSAVVSRLFPLPETE